MVTCLLQTWQGWKCIPVSEISVDALQAKATATARLDVPETSREVHESGCHNVHEQPKRSSLVPPQSWLDHWDAMQVNFGQGLGTVHEVPLGAKVSNYSTQMIPISICNKAGRTEDGLSGDRIGAWM